MDWRFNIVLFVLGISAWKSTEEHVWYKSVMECGKKGKRLPIHSDIDQLKTEQLQLVWAAYYITDMIKPRGTISEHEIYMCGYINTQYIDPIEPDKVGFSGCKEHRHFLKKEKRSKETVKYKLSNTTKTWWDVYNSTSREKVWSGMEDTNITPDVNITDHVRVWIPKVQCIVQESKKSGKWLKRVENCGFIDIYSRNLNFTDCDDRSVKSICVQIDSKDKRGYNGKPKFSMLAIATLSAVSLLIVMIAALSTIWCCRRRARRKKQKSSERSNENDDEGSAHYAVISEVDNTVGTYKKVVDAIEIRENLTNDYSDPYDSKIKKNTDDTAKIDVADTVPIDGENDAAYPSVHAYNTVTVKPGNYDNTYDHVSKMPKKAETFINTYDTCKLSNQAECSHSTSSAKKVTATVHQEARDSVYNHLIGP